MNQTSRFTNFTDDELSALAYAMRQADSPLLGFIPAEVKLEREARLERAAWMARYEAQEAAAYEAGIFG